MALSSTGIDCNRGLVSSFNIKLFFFSILAENMMMIKLLCLKEVITLYYGYLIFIQEKVTPIIKLVVRHRESKHGWS